MKASKSVSVNIFKLIQQKRIGDILFFIGTTLDWAATSQEEQTIVLTRMKQLSSQEASNLTNNTAKIFALESWSFLIAVLIFANVSYARLKDQEAYILTNAPNAPLSSNNNLFGSYLVVIGNLVKVIGFSLTAIGNQIKANNPPG